MRVKPIAIETQHAYALEAFAIPHHYKVYGYVLNAALNGTLGIFNIGVDSAWFDSGSSSSFGAVYSRIIWK